MVDRGRRVSRFQRPLAGLQVDRPGSGRRVVRSPPLRIARGPQPADQQLDLRPGRPISGNIYQKEEPPPARQIVPEGPARQRTRVRQHQVSEERAERRGLLALPIDDHIRKGSRVARPDLPTLGWVTWPSNSARRISSTNTTSSRWPRVGPEVVQSTGPKASGSGKTEIEDGEMLPALGVGKPLPVNRSKTEPTSRARQRGVLTQEDR